MSNNNEIVVLPKTLAQVKEIVDDIYVRSSMDGGHHGGLWKMGARYANVGKIMLDVGSIIKSGHDQKPIYTWNPVAMAPTKQFYKTVAEKMVMKERAYASKSRGKKSDDKKELVEEKPSTEIPNLAPFTINETITNNLIEEAAEQIAKISIHDFTIQELWEEIKAQGGYIKDNRLAYTQTIYLN